MTTSLLRTGAVFTFVGFDLNTDGSVTLRLTCATPGDNLPGSYSVPLTVANIATIQAAGAQAAQLAALNTIVTAYLVAQYRPSVVIAAALAALIGRTVTV